MSDYYVVAEYLEGLRISARPYATLEDATVAVSLSSGLGIDCEVWARVNNVTGALVPVTGYDVSLDTVGVCVASVPRYCDDIARRVQGTPDNVYA